MVRAEDATKSSGLKLVATLVLTLTVGIVIISFDQKQRLAGFKDFFQKTLVFPVKISSAWPSEVLENFSEAFDSHNTLKEENEKLKQELVWLKSNLSNQTALKAESRRLNSLLESSIQLSYPIMIVTILDSFIDSTRHQLEINKGKDSNIYTGQIAVDEFGVVGQITKVNEHTSLIDLITDERQRIPVFVERNRVRLIVRGNGRLDELETDYVSKSSDIRIGDKLITSGLGEKFPKGYAVAVVTHVESSPINDFLTVKSAPLAKLDKVLELLLIKKDNEDEATQINASSLSK